MPASTAPPDTDAAMEINPPRRHQRGLKREEQDPCAERDAVNYPERRQRRTVEMAGEIEGTGEACEHERDDDRRHPAEEEVITPASA